MARVLYDFGCLPDEAYQCLQSEDDEYPRECGCLHCDPKVFSKSSGCKDWLKTLAANRQKRALEFLNEQIRLHTLQKQRDRLARAVSPNADFLDRSFFEEPETQLRQEIEWLTAAKESMDADESTALRARNSEICREQGYREYRKSGLCPNAFAKRASQLHFFDRWGQRLSDRQIVRIINAIERS